ncbi:uncharacterized protein LOC143236001 isoform X2 [Tachypleus tridentatus]|uniref:uncharacterized protein LOC143236001 isoform X2 n=1 Tax=Tachypleus tridentatus TaxID=6853 RepID=UPI003FD5C980
MFDIVTLSFYGWFLLGLIVFVLGSVLISRRVQNWNDKNSETTACDNEKDLFKHERLTGTICVEANGPSLDKHDEETKEASAKFDNSGARCYGIDDLVSSRPISNSQAPLTQGTDANSVDWINSCIKWLYSNHNADLFVAEWLCSLNDQIRRASSETENDVRVELLQIQPESLPPHLSDFCTTPESNDNITTTCKVKNENLGFKILIICKVGENTSAIHYDLTIDKLEGKLKVFSNVKELLFIFCFVERPDVKLTLKPFHGPPKILATDQNSMEAVAMDILINTIATTAVSLHFAKQTDFPKFQSKGRNSLILEDLSTSPSRHPSTRHEQRLLLKIIKATGLGGKKGCQEPYCVVKLDEPFQRFQTSPAKNASNPFWDEPFLFNLNETSAEIVFEIYEFGNDGEEQLLSLGMIGVKEIINSPSQRLVIPLQSQPTRSDFVTGSITVEFLIMEGAEVPVVADIYETQPGLLKKTDNQLIQEGIEVTTSTLDKVESMEAKSVEHNADQFHRDQFLLDPVKTQDIKAYPLIPATTSESSNKIKIVEKSRNIGFPPDLELSTPISFADCPPIPPVYTISTEHCCTRSHDTKLTGNSAKSTTSKVLSSLPVIRNRFLEKHLMHNSSGKEKSDFYGNAGRKINTIKVAASVEPTVKNNAVKKTSDLSDHLSLTPSSLQPYSLLEGQLSSSSVLKEKDSCKDNVVAEFKVKTLGNKNALDEELVVHYHSPTDNSQVYLSDHGDFQTLPKSDVHTTHTPTVEEETKKQSWNIEQTGSDETLTDTAAQEMDKIGNFSTYENGTLVIHSAHKEVIRPVLKSEVTADSNNASSSPISKSKQTLSRQSMSSSASEKDEVFISSAEKGGTKDKRSFMGTLRKRLSFRKNRSKSVEQKGKPEESIGQENTKSVSTDHSKSVPSSQEVSSARSSDGNAFLDVPGVAYDRNSTISEGSGISISSQRTYVHEQSTLVVETNENGVIRHYLVPGSLANQSKWGKRGAKLHIYNDHIFVAKHLPGSTICQVCKKKLSRRPGKQGYECRDCSLLCHKSCHVRVEMYCPNTTINTMDIAYMKEPRAKSKSS